MATRGLARAEDEGAAGGVEDVGGDDHELVDAENAFDLLEEAVQEAEVAAGELGDPSDGLGV